MNTLKIRFALRARRLPFAALAAAGGPGAKVWRAVALASCTIAAALPGCTSESPASSDRVASSSQDLYGPTSYDLGGCTSDQQIVINRTAFFGRTASSSNVFRQCVTKAMSQQIFEAPYNVGPYDYCTGDPGKGSSLDVQTANLLALSQTPNKLNVGCDDGTGGNASATQNDPGALGTSPEAFTYHKWFQNNWNLPEQASGWPFSQMAGAMWHEALHQEGYHHGGNQQAGSAEACGLTGATAASFNFQVNTANYIVGGCMESIIDQSGTACGLHSAQCPGGLMLLDQLDGATCSCVRDPVAPNCIITAASDGTIDAQCTHDAARDPITVFESNAWGQWVGVYSYPSVATGSLPMLTGLAAGTTGTFVGCTFDAKEMTAKDWLAQVGPGGYGCDAVATTVVVPARPPGCAPTSTCSEEYYQPANGQPAHTGVIDTISIACPSSSAYVEELVNGVWVGLQGYSPNNGYPPPSNPVVFDTFNKGMAPTSSVSVRACVSVGGVESCDLPLWVAASGCAAQPCVPATTCIGQGGEQPCGIWSDGCGGKIDCRTSCPTGQSCIEKGSNPICEVPSTCTPKSKCPPHICGMVDDGCGNFLCCGSPDKCCI